MKKSLAIALTASLTLTSLPPDAWAAGESTSKVSSSRDANGPAVQFTSENYGPRDRIAPLKVQDGDNWLSLMSLGIRATQLLVPVESAVNRGGSTLTQMAEVSAAAPWGIKPVNATISVSEPLYLSNVSGIKPGAVTTPILKDISGEMRVANIKARTSGTEWGALIDNNIKNPYAIRAGGSAYKKALEEASRTYKVIPEDKKKELMAEMEKYEKDNLPGKLDEMEKTLDESVKLWAWVWADYYADAAFLYEYAIVEIDGWGSKPGADDQKCELEKEIDEIEKEIRNVEGDIKRTTDILKANANACQNVRSLGNQMACELKRKAEQDLIHLNEKLKNTRSRLDRVVTSWDGKEKNDLKTILKYVKQRIPVLQKQKDDAKKNLDSIAKKLADFQKNLPKYFTVDYRAAAQKRIDDLHARISDAYKTRDEYDPTRGLRGATFIKPGPPPMGLLDKAKGFVRDHGVMWGGVGVVAAAGLLLAAGAISAPYAVTAALLAGATVAISEIFKTTQSGGSRSVGSAQDLRASQKAHAAVMEDPTQLKNAASKYGQFQRDLNALVEDAQSGVKDAMENLRKLATEKNIKSALDAKHKIVKWNKSLKEANGQIECVADGRCTVETLGVVASEILGYAGKPDEIKNLNRVEWKRVARQLAAIKATNGAVADFRPMLPAIEKSFALAKSINDSVEHMASGRLDLLAGRDGALNERIAGLQAKYNIQLGKDKDFQNFLKLNGIAFIDGQTGKVASSWLKDYFYKDFLNSPYYSLPLSSKDYVSFDQLMTGKYNALSSDQKALNWLYDQKDNFQDNPFRYSAYAVGLAAGTVAAIGTAPYSVPLALLGGTVVGTGLSVESGRHVYRQGGEFGEGFWSAGRSYLSGVLTTAPYRFGPGLVPETEGLVGKAIWESARGNRAAAWLIKSTNKPATWVGDVGRSLGSVRPFSGMLPSEAIGADLTLGQLAGGFVKYGTYVGREWMARLGQFLLSSSLSLYGAGTADGSLSGHGLMGAITTPIQIIGGGIALAAGTVGGILGAPGSYASSFSDTARAVGYQGIFGNAVAGVWGVDPARIVRDVDLSAYTASLTGDPSKYQGATTFLVPGQGWGLSDQVLKDRAFGEGGSFLGQTALTLWRANVVAGDVSMFGIGGKMAGAAAARVMGAGVRSEFVGSVAMQLPMTDFYKGIVKSWRDESFGRFAHEVIVMSMGVGGAYHGVAGTPKTQAIEQVGAAAFKESVKLGVATGLAVGLGHLVGANAADTVVAYAGAFAHPLAQQVRGAYMADLANRSIPQALELIQRAEDYRMGRSDVPVRPEDFNAARQLIADNLHKVGNAYYLNGLKLEDVMWRGQSLSKTPDMLGEVKGLRGADLRAPLDASYTARRGQLFEKDGRVYEIQGQVEANGDHLWEAKPIVSVETESSHSRAVVPVRKMRASNERSGQEFEEVARIDKSIRLSDAELIQLLRPSEHQLIDARDRAFEELRAGRRMGLPPETQQQLEQRYTDSLKKVEDFYKEKENISHLRNDMRDAELAGNTAVEARLMRETEEIWGKAREIESLLREHDLPSDLPISDPVAEWQARAEKLDKDYQDAFKADRKERTDESRKALLDAEKALQEHRARLAEAQRIAEPDNMLIRAQILEAAKREILAEYVKSLAEGGKRLTRQELEAQIKARAEKSITEGIKLTAEGGALELTSKSETRGIIKTVLKNLHESGRLRMETLSREKQMAAVMRNALSLRDPIARKEAVQKAKAIQEQLNAELAVIELKPLNERIGELTEKEASPKGLSAYEALSLAESRMRARQLKLTIDTATKDAQARAQFKQEAQKDFARLSRELTKAQEQAAVQLLRVESGNKARDIDKFEGQVAQNEIAQSLLKDIQKKLDANLQEINQTKDGARRTLLLATRRALEAMAARIQSKAEQGSSWTTFEAAKLEYLHDLLRQRAVELAKLQGQSAGPIEGNAVFEESMAAKEAASALKERGDLLSEQIHESRLMQRHIDLLVEARTTRNPLNRLWLESQAKILMNEVRQIEEGLIDKVLKGNLSEKTIQDLQDGVYDEKRAEEIIHEVYDKLNEILKAKGLPGFAFIGQDAHADAMNVGKPDGEKIGKYDWAVAKETQQYKSLLALLGGQKSLNLETSGGKSLLAAIFASTMSGQVVYVAPTVSLTQKLGASDNIAGVLLKDIIEQLSAGHIKGNEVKSRRNVHNVDEAYEKYQQGHKEDLLRMLRDPDGVLLMSRQTHGFIFLMAQTDGAVLEAYNYLRGRVPIRLIADEVHNLATPMNFIMSNASNETLQADSPEWRAASRLAEVFKSKGFEIIDPDRGDAYARFQALDGNDGPNAKPALWYNPKTQAVYLTDKAMAALRTAVNGTTYGTAEIVSLAKSWGQVEYGLKWGKPVGAVIDRADGRFKVIPVDAESKLQESMTYHDKFYAAGFALHPELLAKAGYSGPGWKLVHISDTRLQVTESQALERYTTKQGMTGTSEGARALLAHKMAFDVETISTAKDRQLQEITIVKDEMSDREIQIMAANIRAYVRTSVQHGDIEGLRRGLIYGLSEKEQAKLIAALGPDISVRQVSAKDLTNEELKSNLTGQDYYKYRGKEKDAADQIKSERPADVIILTSDSGIEGENWRGDYILYADITQSTLRGEKYKQLINRVQRVNDQDGTFEAERHAIVREGALRESLRSLEVSSAQQRALLDKIWNVEKDLSGLSIFADAKGNKLTWGEVLQKHLELDPETMQKLSKDELRLIDQERAELLKNVRGLGEIDGRLHRLDQVLRMHLKGEIPLPAEIKAMLHHNYRQALDATGGFRGEIHEAFLKTMVLENLQNFSREAAEHLKRTEFRHQQLQTATSAEELRLAKTYKEAVEKAIQKAVNPESRDASYKPETQKTEAWDTVVKMFESERASSLAVWKELRAALPQDLSGSGRYRYLGNEIDRIAAEVQGAKPGDRASRSVRESDQVHSIADALSYARVLSDQMLPLESAASPESNKAMRMTQDMIDRLRGGPQPPAAGPEGPKMRGPKDATPPAAGRPRSLEGIGPGFDRSVPVGQTGVATMDLVDEQPAVPAAPRAAPQALTNLDLYNLKVVVSHAVQADAASSPLLVAISKAESLKRVRDLLEGEVPGMERSQPTWRDHVRSITGQVTHEDGLGRRLIQNVKQNASNVVKLDESGAGGHRVIWNAAKILPAAVYQTFVPVRIDAAPYTRGLLIEAAGQTPQAKHATALLLKEALENKEVVFNEGSRSVHEEGKAIAQVALAMPEGQREEGVGYTVEKVTQNGESAVVFRVTDLSGEAALAIDSLIHALGEAAAKTGVAPITVYIELPEGAEMRGLSIRNTASDAQKQGVTVHVVTAGQTEVRLPANRKSRLSRALSGFKPAGSDAPLPASDALRDLAQAVDTVEKGASPLDPQSEQLLAMSRVDPSFEQMLGKERLSDLSKAQETNDLLRRLLHVAPFLKRALDAGYFSGVPEDRKEQVEQLLNTLSEAAKAHNIQQAYEAISAYAEDAGVRHADAKGEDVGPAARSHGFVVNMTGVAGDALAGSLLSWFRKPAHVPALQGLISSNRPLIVIVDEGTDWAERNVDFHALLKTQLIAERGAHSGRDEYKNTRVLLPEIKVMTKAEYEAEQKFRAAMVTEGRKNALALLPESLKAGAATDLDARTNSAGVALTPVTPASSSPGRSWKWLPDIPKLEWAVQVGVMAIATAGTVYAQMNGFLSMEGVQPMLASILPSFASLGPDPAQASTVKAAFTAAQPAGDVASGAFALPIGLAAAVIWVGTALKAGVQKTLSSGVRLALTLSQA